MLCFTVDYPRLPFKSQLNFNLLHGSSQFIELFLYIFHVIVINDEEFIMHADFIWTPEDDPEISNYLVGSKARYLMD